MSPNGNTNASEWWCINYRSGSDATYSLYIHVYTHNFTSQRFQEQQNLQLNPTDHDFH